MNFWNARLDELKLKFSLRSELELAILLKMHPAALGHIRSNLRPPSTATAIRILDKSGYVLTRNLFLKLLPNKLQSTVSKAERDRGLNMGMANLQTQKWLQAKAEGNITKIDWIEAIDQLKELKSLKTDVKLAELLEISAPAVAQIRKGKRPLPVTAKIILLAQLGIELDEEALKLTMAEDLQSAVIESSTKSLVKIPSGEPDPNQGYDMNIPMTSTD
jgi:transcriptional regulator with XRE-family HTH domain